MNSGTLSTGQTSSLGSPNGPTDLKVCGTGCAGGILAQSIGGGKGGGSGSGGFAIAAAASGGGDAGASQAIDFEPSSEATAFRRW